jgi:hypothetical protein
VTFAQQPIKREKGIPEDDYWKSIPGKGDRTDKDLEEAFVVAGEE